MHELSLVMNILEIAGEQMKAHHAHKLERIELEIGSLAGVEMDAFNFAWEAAVGGTDMAVTEKIIHQIPAKARCLECNLEYSIDHLFSPCPNCGEYLNELLQGKEMRIKSLTVN